MFVKKCSLDKAYAWLKKHQFDRLEVHEAVYALSKEELAFAYEDCGYFLALLVLMKKNGVWCFSNDAE